MKTARIKFCGGCNPGYDRVAVAEKIKHWLLTAGYRIITEDDAAEAVIVVCGCECACADVSRVERGRIIFITNPGMAEGIDATG